MADIVIRGMEMPKDCFSCPCCDTHYGTCKAVKRNWIVTSYSIPVWCPLVPLPEGHGRLVDADALVADTSFFDGGDWHYGYSAKQIQNAPTILEAEGGGEDG